MAVLVQHRLVVVLVLVVLGEMEIDADGHRSAAAMSDRDRLAEHGQRQHRADEGRGREIGARPRGAELAQPRTNSTRLTP